MERQEESLHIPEIFLEDVTQQAVWHVSSAKAGTGVVDLIDGSENTFWQSDNQSPHYITAVFPRKLRIARVDLFINYQLDDTYTPRVLTIRLGPSKESLMTVGEFHLQHPTGWQKFEINPVEHFKKAFPGFQHVQRIFRSRWRLQRDLTSPSSRILMARESMGIESNPESPVADNGSDVIGLRAATPTHRRAPAGVLRESLGASPNKTGFAQDVHRNTLLRMRTQPTPLLNIMAYYWAEATRALCPETDGIVLDKKTCDDMGRWYFPAFVVQLGISQNYQNGQDSHVRQIRVLAFKDCKQ